MSNSGIKYIVTRGFSGYGEWGKLFVKALSGHSDLSTRFFSWDNTETSGKDDLFVKSKLYNKIQYDTVIHHTIPAVYDRFIEQNKINIAVTIWETDTLNPKWVNSINRMDSVIVPSEWNKKVFLESGVLVPVFVVPFPMRFTDLPIQCKLPSDTYTFYSIGQLSIRKGLDVVIDSFVTAFTKKDKVKLVLKVYDADFSFHSKKIVRRFVNNRLQKFPNHPEVYLIDGELTQEQISNIHLTSNCYVSLSRGEGWGMGLFDALSFGNTVITTKDNGCYEYIKDYCVGVDYSKVPVNGVPVEWYTHKHNWFEPNLLSAVKAMKDVYSGVANFKSNFKDSNTELFSFERVGQLLINAVNDTRGTVQRKKNLQSFRQQAEVAV